jgi:hypothetical protein
VLGIIDPRDAACHSASFHRLERSHPTPAADLRPVKRHRHPLAYLARALTTGPGTFTAPTLAFG